MPKRQYTEEFKAEAARLAASVVATKRRGAQVFRWRLWVIGTVNAGGRMPPSLWQLEVLRCLLDGQPWSLRSKTAGCAVNWRAPNSTLRYFEKRWLTYQIVGVKLFS